MKRLLALLLVLTILTGCATVRPTEPSGETEPSATAPTEPPAPSLYAPDSLVEQQTNGAVREYPLGGACDGMLLVDGRVVLYYLDEQMQMKAYTGETLTLDAVASHHISFPTGGKGIQAAEQGVFYYDPGTNAVVILDRDLKEKYHVELTESIRGIPVTNEAMDTVYYCTAEGIRALNLDTGIAHMLRHQDDYSGVLTGQLFGGSLLVCQAETADGSVMTEFISAETGLHAGKEESISWVKGTADTYLLEREDKNGARYLFGSREGDTSEFRMPGEGKTLLAALELGCVLTVSKEDSRYTLDLYRLDSGLRTASVTLEGLENLRNVVADPAGFLWFMDDASLYRWDVAKSAVSDETVYTSPWYTGTDPNEAGLNQCQADADALGRKYGLEIRIWKDAVAAPWEKMTSEFRVEVFDAALEELETLLSLFSEDMLEEMGSICKDKKICISIVADTGTDEGQVAWVDGNAYIAVEAGETLRRELLRTVYRVMDTYVLSESSRLDQWDAEKPAEERAQYFVEAMTEENGAFFEKRSAQSKLRTLCRAIREAFGMKKYDAELPWEQYLNNPLY